MSERLVVLVASGASIYAKVPSTDDLTKAVASMQFHAVRPNKVDIYPSPIPTDKFSLSIEKKEFICWIIFRALQKVFNRPNFEHVLAALEQLEIIAGSIKDNYRANDYLHILSPFMYFRDEYEILREPQVLNITRWAVIRLIAQNIINSLFFRDQLANPTKEFIDRLKSKYQLSVFTLNYDDLLDLSGDDWFDGFEPIGDQAPNVNFFNHMNFIQNFENKKNHNLVHLHGSVRYGYLPRELPFQLVKFNNRNDALESLRSTTTGNRMIAGEDVTAFPIISGLNKLAKLGHSPFPYAYYYRAFIDTIISCNRLLIIGYGGSDKHLNNWLEQFVAIHGDQRRVCYISWLDGKQTFERTDLNDLLRLFSGQGNFQESMAYFNKKRPASGFQEYGRLALIPCGFPIEQKSIVNRMLKFLD